MTEPSSPSPVIPPAPASPRPVRPVRRGARVWPSSFKDRLTERLPGPADMVRIMREGGFRTGLSGVAEIPVRREGLPGVSRTDTAVTWVGHATFVVRIGGLTVLTDPVWSRRIPGVRARLTPPGVEWDALPPVDAVVISHNHYDHLDLPTIRRLPKGTPFFVPGGLGRWFRRRGYHDVTEMDWWESVPVGGVEFAFVPAHHWSRRGPFDTCRTLWGGWVLTAAPEAGGRRVYFAGDTAYGHRFAEIGERYPGIDVALMPVGAYEPRWFMRSAHVDPQEAVRATLDAGAQRMATMHWGTFMLSAEHLLAPVEEARKAWEAASRPREDLWDLAVGESRVLAPRS
ncbi:MBL fold metallo-hydrolase [Bailinhaonella thermotolerans]|nr:MBL fold metallo-hydrolase [Bailinhaonella thermotolerans]